MTKRISLRIHLYIVFALIILMASWEANLVNAAVVEQTIPEDSIRVRILANSDAPGDQWVKRQVRDEMITQMKDWVQGPQTIEEARKRVRTHLRELHSVIGEVLHKYGFTYEYKVELGRIPFPTKMYGNRVYPAGDYEALLITLGKGAGQNWWCVLFPPLCFVNINTGDAVSKEAVLTSQPAAGEGKASLTDTVGDTEIRFFLWDLIRSIWDSIKELFR